MAGGQGRRGGGVRGRVAPPRGLPHPRHRQLRDGRPRGPRRTLPRLACGRRCRVAGGPPPGARAHRAQHAHPPGLRPAAGAWSAPAWQCAWLPVSSHHLSTSPPLWLPHLFVPRWHATPRAPCPPWGSLCAPSSPRSSGPRTPGHSSTPSGPRWMSPMPRPWRSCRPPPPRQGGECQHDCRMVDALHTLGSQCASPHSCKRSTAPPLCGVPLSLRPSCPWPSPSSAPLRPRLPRRPRASARPWRPPVPSSPSPCPSPRLPRALPPPTRLPPPCRCPARAASRQRSFWPLSPRGPSRRTARASAPRSSRPAWLRARRAAANSVVPAPHATHGRSTDRAAPPRS